MNKIKLIFLMMFIGTTMHAGVLEQLSKHSHAAKIFGGIAVSGVLGWQLFKTLNVEKELLEYDSWKKCLSLEPARKKILRRALVFSGEIKAYDDNQNKMMYCYFGCLGALCFTAYSGFLWLIDS